MASIAFLSRLSRIKDYIISTNIIQQASPLVAMSKPENFPHYSAVNASLAYHTNVGVWEPYFNLNMMRTYMSLYNTDGRKSRMTSLTYQCRSTAISTCATIGCLTYC